MFCGPLEDRIAIRELVDAYTDAIHQRDEQAWGSTWTDNGVWHVGGAEIRGRDQIVGAWREAMAGFNFVSFQAAPGMIAVDGVKASARIYTSEYLVDHQEKIVEIRGQYDDNLLKTDGGWRFQSRIYTILRVI